MARLKADASFSSERQRVRAFIARGGGCRATYYNQAKKLRSAVAAPKIQLTASPPESEPQMVSIIELLRQRFKDLGQG